MNRFPKSKSYMKKGTYFPIILLLCFLSCSVSGMQAYNDSLTDVIKKSRNINERQHAMVLLADKIMPAHLDSAGKLIYKASELKNSSDVCKKADYYNTIAVYQWYNKEYDSAIMSLTPLIALPETNELLPKLARAYNNLGTLYSILNYPDSTSKYLHESLRIDNKLENNYGLAKTYHDLSSLYYKQGYYEQALRYQLESNSINESENDTMRMIHGYNGLGNIYSLLLETEKSMQAYQRAIELDQTYEPINMLASIYNNIASLLCEEPEHFEDAISYARKGIIEAENSNKGQDVLTLLYANIAGAYQSVNEPHNALQNLYKSLALSRDIQHFKQFDALYTSLAKSHQMLGNYDSAKYYAQKSIEITETSKSLRWRSKALLILATADSVAGNYRSAFDNYKKAIALRDSIWNIESRNRISELQIIYEMEKKESENRLLTEQNKLSERIIKSQKLLIALSTFILIMVFIILIREHLLKKKMLKKNADILRQQKIINQKNIELKEINDTKDKFFSVISHDLRGPFSSLTGLLEVLSEEYDQMKDGEKLSIINALKQNTANTYSLLVNLLDWSQAQTGTLENKPQKIDLHAITDQVFSLLEPRAKQKMQILINEIPDFAFAFADPQLTQSVLINLVNNAIKFSSPSSITRVSATLYDNIWKICVIDQGIGIPEDKTENLFKIGSNFKRTGTSKETGTGLGLIMVKEFLQMMQGSISVESEIGKGSAFCFTLPVPPSD